MIYVFVFLGEFGYELLNWQGVVRKFSERKNINDKIVVASRKGLALFYENADLYVDISELEYFKRSVATGYGSNSPDIKLYKDYDNMANKRFINGTYSFKNFLFKYRLRKQIKSFVDVAIEQLFEKKEDVRYIFSDRCTFLKGLQFGRMHRDKRNIYDKLDIRNNRYLKLTPKIECKAKIEKILGMSLDDDFVLCQMGSRSIVQRSKINANPELVIKEISKRKKVILLDFSTGRNKDSGSEFSCNMGCEIYRCNSLEEQSVLISNASCCVFFTEGDFRSHNYLPPFFGRNVYSVADKGVYELPTTPIDFWNDNVFNFGGKIIPIHSEELMNEKYFDSFIESVVKENKLMPNQ